MVSSLIEQSQGKKSNFGGVTELLCKRRVVAWIDVIVKPVDCCYIIPLAHTAEAIITLFLFLWSNAVEAELLKPPPWNITTATCWWHRTCWFLFKRMQRSERN